MKSFFKMIFCLCCLISLLSACGQSGRLYLPEPQTNTKAGKQ